MNELEIRLAELGDRLDLDADSVVDDVIARLDEPDTPTRSHGRGRWGWLRVAAVIVVVIAVAVAATPGSRRTVARWLGLEQVRIEVRSDLERTGPPVTLGLPGPGDSRIMEVDGSTILVSALDGRIDSGMITKSVASSDSVTEVDVAGKPGLWIIGAPHQVSYTTADGETQVVRAAGDTLLWQDGPVLYRVEGFDAVDEALAFAASLESS